MGKRKPAIGVIGGKEVSQSDLDLAYELGVHIANNDALLICGGLGGIMEAASRGAAENNGTVLGVLPGEKKSDANPWVTIALPTGMGIGRNTLVVRFSDVLIAFPGSYGTLSEIGLALNSGKTVVYLPGAWDLKKIASVESARYKEAFTAPQAVGLALDALR
ncbi:MAG: TIGR00725 family protein [Chitinivibrionales bacterium]|nr:TIGR00725 family protein [Chitinivibrionales bacterium]